MLAFNASLNFSFVVSGVASWLYDNIEIGNDSEDTLSLLDLDLFGCYLLGGGIYRHRCGRSRDREGSLPVRNRNWPGSDHDGRRSPGDKTIGADRDMIWNSGLQTVEGKGSVIARHYGAPIPGGRTFKNDIGAGNNVVIHIGDCAAYFSRLGIGCSDLLPDYRINHTGGEYERRRETVSCLLLAFAKIHDWCRKPISSSQVLMRTIAIWIRDLKIFQDQFCCLLTAWEESRHPILRLRL